jgi:hypothetical protein
VLPALFSFQEGMRAWKKNKREKRERDEGRRKEAQWT